MDKSEKKMSSLFCTARNEFFSFEVFHDKHKKRFQKFTQNRLEIQYLIDLKSYTDHVN